jgi:hypothetical protein
LRVGRRSVDATFEKASRFKRLGYARRLVALHNKICLIDDFLFLIEDVSSMTPAMVSTSPSA